MDDNDQNTSAPRAKGGRPPKAPDQMITRIPTDASTRPPKGQRVAADKMSAEARAQKQAYDRVQSMKSRATRRRNRMTIDSFTGVDRLAVMQRLQSEGYGPRQIDVLLPAEMRAEHERLRFERELKAAERRANDAEVIARAERAQREQVENKLHNLNARKLGAR